MTDPEIAPVAPKSLTDVFSELARANASQTKGARSFARLAAVQALYQMDMAQTDIADVLAQFVTHRFPHDPQAVAEGASHGDDTDPAIASDAAPGAETDGMLPAAPDQAYFADIVRGVVRLQREIDPGLDALLATGWRLGRIDSILRAILRSAAYELKARADVPARVIINDYVDVAHSFFEGDEPKVTNAVLDRLAKKLRPAEFASQRGSRP